jgi:hypothetical protein
MALSFINCLENKALRMFQRWSDFSYLSHLTIPSTSNIEILILFCQWRNTQWSSERLRFTQLMGVQTVISTAQKFYYSTLFTSAHISCSSKQPLFQEMVGLSVHPFLPCHPVSIMLCTGKFSQALLMSFRYFIYPCRPARDKCWICFSCTPNGQC